VSMPCELLEWDTQFFGCRIARVVGHQLNNANAADVMDWCKQERIDCLYFLADADHPETRAVAEAHGFGMKDVRLTYMRRLESVLQASPPNVPAGVVLRPARQDDVPALETLAQDSYTKTRFYFDHCFPRPAVRRMYQVWIRQSVLGQADLVLVLEVDGRAAGFLTGHLVGNRHVRGGLGGLDAEHRGRGLGLYLFDGFNRWFARQGVETVSHDTQARNVAAQRLFQKMGFLTQTVQVWYHKWFDSSVLESERRVA
jgi:RimJ/RimL family protein N-acetyltransferase